jgi:hypothetical protein
MAASRRRKAKVADPVDVEKFLQDLPEEYMVCRDIRHRWPDRPDDVGWLDQRYQIYWRIHRCERCTAERYQELEAGMVFKSTIKYPRGFLLRGLGRINGDGLAVVRMTSDVRFLDGQPKPKKKRTAGKKRAAKKGSA